MACNGQMQEIKEGGVGGGGGSMLLDEGGGDRGRHTPLAIAVSMTLASKPFFMKVYEQ
jgi:hypothetical protein